MNDKKFLTFMFKLFIVLVIGSNLSAYVKKEMRMSKSNANEINSTEQFPIYSGTPSIILNENIPDFSDISIPESVETLLSPLDELGRTGQAYALLGEENLYGDRQDILNLKPSGWHTVRYDDLIEDKYLFNRCHLVANMFDDDNNVIENLITGTRYLNVEGMLPYEIQIADYIQDTHNHVVYCVTPIYEEDNLIASGVQLEAMSYEDNGESFILNVYCFNVQPNIEINYASGESRKLSK